MTLEIQKFLREYEHGCRDLAKTLAELEARQHITAKQHSVYPNLYLFKYDQIESDFSHPIVQECRGIILDHACNWDVVAFPFKKFHNMGEHLAARVDWATARVQEKLDGSLCTLYHYDGAWHVATSGCPDGTNQVGDFNKTFGELFWECFNSQNLPKDLLCPVYTYMWELTSPMNRVVVDHHDSRVTLIGVRELIKLKELDVSWFKPSFPVVQEYPLNNPSACLEAATKLNPLEHEGYVVVDSKFNRVKIKSPAYIALHHIKDSCSLSKIAEVIRAGEYQEFSLALESYPDLKQKFLDMVRTYEQVVDSCNLIYGKIRGIENQKDFALEATQCSYSSVLFSMRKTGKSARAIIKDMNTNAYLRLLGIK